MCFLSRSGVIINVSCIKAVWQKELYCLYSKENEMKPLARYRFVWRVLRLVGRRYLMRKLRFEGESVRKTGPMLILCNHNTDWDPFLLGCVFPEYISFVASEHIFRWVRIGKLISALQGPILRLKGKTAADTALNVLRRLRSGVNVGIFAEGDRSFNGLTGDILPSTGKLAKYSGVPLLTYRLNGGYFTSPRWSGSDLRPGKMTGRVVNIYTPEQLRAMSTDEINSAIKQDLFVDAYAEQRENPISYRGKRLAEHMETALCFCPRCESIGTLTSKGDTFRCVCGLEVKYNEYGFLEGDGLPFDSITEWDKLQAKKLCALADARTGLLFSDDGMILKRVFATTHTDSILGEGEMSLYSDRLECCSKTFSLSELEGFALHGAQTVDFSIGSESYEISSRQVRCTRKYKTVIQYLRQKNASR